MKPYHLLPPNTRIDTHCHLFNQKVLSWRLLIDFVQSRVKLPIPLRADNDAMPNSESGPLQSIKGALNFLKTGMQPTFKDVYKILIKTEKGYAIVPLMFDLDYCMKGAPAELEKDILAAYNQILAEDREELLQMKQDTNYFNNSNEKEKEIDQLIQTIDTLPEPGYQVNQLETGLLHQEAPFLSQENQLVDLQKKYPDTVFPFYVVDPRRQENYTLQNDTYDLSPILNRLTVNGGHFYGIKLYALNGYSPADPELMALYPYCEQQNIPITAHYSGRFASFAKTVHIKGFIYKDEQVQEQNGNIPFGHYKITDKERVHEKAQMLNHPLIGEKVLEKYPKLTLNLLHFGSFESTEEWSRHIIRLMKRYPNLYTDFSCVAGKNLLENMYKIYYSKAEATIKNRFLYGSEFYLNMLFIDNMKQYIQPIRKNIQRRRNERNRGNKSEEVFGDGQLIIDSS